MRSGTIEERRGVQRVTLVVAALVAVRLIAAAFAAPSSDELYYLLWSRFPAWSYYDHPPMVAWWMHASTTLFGDSWLGLRAVSILSTIPTSLALYATGRVLFDASTAERAVLWLNATLLIGVGGISATPDAPALLFWTLTILFLVLALQSGRGWWWLLVGASAGLGVASKLTDLFLGLGILLCLVTDRERRRWLLSPWPWAGGVAALAAVAPVIAWNAGHDWVTFTKQFGRLEAHGLDPLNVPEMLATQFALLNPLIAIFAGLGIWAWLRGRDRYPVADIALLGWTIAPLVLYMAVHALHDQVQAHWLGPIFPTLSLIAAAAADRAPAERWAGGRALAFPLGVALSFAGMLAAINPGGLIPLRYDVAHVVRGWDGLARDAEALRASVHAQWIAVTYYGLEGAAVYYLRDTSTSVVAVAERQRYAFVPPPDEGFVDRAVLIVSDIADPAFFARCFENVTPVGTLARKSGEEADETYVAFRADRALPAAIDPGCDAAQK